MKQYGGFYLGNAEHCSDDDSIDVHVAPDGVYLTVTETVSGEGSPSRLTRKARVRLGDVDDTIYELSELLTGAALEYDEEYNRTGGRDGEE